MRKNQAAALLLAGAMVLPLTGCSKDDVTHFIFGSAFDAEESEHVTIKPEEASIYVEDAGQIFSHAEYTREMFFGKYAAEGVVNTEMTGEAKAEYMLGAETFSITGKHGRLTAMPYRVEFGPHCNVSPLNYLSGYEWALLYYYDAQGNSVQVDAAYSVDGNSLNLQLIRQYTFDSGNNVLDYEFSGDTLRYYYTLDNNGLMLSNSSGKIQLFAEELRGENPAPDVKDANLSADSECLEGIEMLHLTPESSYVTVNGERCEVKDYELGKDGLFRLRWTDSAGTEHAVQTAYLYCDDDGIVLMDDAHTYYYNKRSNELYTKKVTTNLSMEDSEALQNMSAAEIDALQNEVAGLYADLQASFEEAGVEVTVDSETGEVALNSVILFKVDEYFITPDGEDMLKRFLKAYSYVLFSDKYKGFVSAIEIEGHTDPTGLAYRNEVLSQARADQVLAFCLADNNGLPDEITAELAPMMSAVGYASAHPVFAADGSVDLEASRRVSFHFIVDLARAAELSEE